MNEKNEGVKGRYRGPGEIERIEDGKDRQTNKNKQKLCAYLLLRLACDKGWVGSYI